MLKNLAILTLLGLLATVSSLSVTAQDKPANAPEKRIAESNSDRKGRPSSDGQREDQTPQKSPSVVVQVEAPAIDSHSADADEAKETERKLATFTGWLAVFTLLLTIVGGVQGYFLFRQASHLRQHAGHLHALAGAASDNAKAAKDAAEATLKQANYMVAAERAWVQVYKVAPTAGASDRLEGKRQVFVHCEAKNYGKTPARVLGLNVLLAEGPISDPGKTWDERLYDFEEKAIPKWIIVPGVPKPLHHPIQGFIGDPGDPLPEPRTGNAHFIHGVIRYWDSLSETDRITRFCYRWHGGEELPGVGWHVAGGERCNQES